LDLQVHQPLEIDHIDDTKEAPDLEQMDDIANLECKLTDDEYHIRNLENPSSSHLVNYDVPIPKSVKKSVWTEFYSKTEKKICFFTGLKKNIRNVIWDFLGEAKYSLTMFDYKKKVLSGKMKSISVEDQFFLFLVVFRRNITYQEAGWMFAVSTQVATRVFKTWLSFLYFKFKDMKDDMFIKREDLPKPLPKPFRNKLLRETRVVSVVETLRAKIVHFGQDCISKYIPT